MTSSLGYLVLSHVFSLVAILGHCHQLVLIIVLLALEKPPEVKISGSCPPSGQGGPCRTSPMFLSVVPKVTTALSGVFGRLGVVSPLPVDAHLELGIKDFVNRVLINVSNTLLIDSLLLTWMYLERS